MTISYKTEYVDACTEVLENSSRRPNLVLYLLSLVGSCEQRNGFVGLSFMSEYQHAAAPKGVKAHKASACANDVFDLSVKAFCHSIGAPKLPGVQDVGHALLYCFCNRAHFRHFGPSCDGYPMLQGKLHFFSVYFTETTGVNKTGGIPIPVPFSEYDRVDHPVSLYAATKKSNELMAHAYSKLYSIPATGLRFFTVYGPMGRPDMAYFGFTNKLVAGETIKIFNMGDCKRDFTYVDDIVEGVRRVMDAPPVAQTGADGLPQAAHRVYNIGNSNPENLLDFVDTLQRVLVEEGVLPPDYDFESHRELVPMQPGDVPVTYADTSALERDTGFKPSTPLEEGLRRFATWYKGYYQL